jgi:hypothetical protein
MADEVEKKFNAEMVDICHRAKSEAGYNATRFITAGAGKPKPRPTPSRRCPTLCRLRLGEA